jgi:hypothetical protein
VIKNNTVFVVGAGASADRESLHGNYIGMIERSDRAPPSLAM